jgi:predicted O-methyltransferase YrrM
VPLDSTFLELANRVRVPTMGTERVSYLLYALVMMLRPRSVLEIGAGHTTMFLARALADVQADVVRERSDAPPESSAGSLYVIDDLSYPASSAAALPDALERAGLAVGVHLMRRDFRGGSADLPAAARPLDLIWFDCRAATDGGVAFFNEYWPLVREGGGVVAVHSLLVPLPTPAGGRHQLRVPSPLLNELRKRHADAGRERTFEVVNFAEPGKRLQGDVTLISKLSGLDRVRDSAFDADVAMFGGATVGALTAL